MVVERVGIDRVKERLFSVRLAGLKRNKTDKKIKFSTNF